MNIRNWLILSAFMVVTMIFIGGLTRLTDSGLSMTGWRPITGWLPPLSENAWEEEFNSYKKSPEFQLVNHNFSVEDFKGIFWLEFIHRILGRITGLIIIIPYLFFALRGNIPKHMPYIIMSLLVVFQGILGWYMVKSGLSSNPYVSHWRLAAHLSTAIILYIVILWEIFSLSPTSPSKFRINTNIPLILILIQIFLGAMVAGLDAGLIYNEFPLMGGRYIPEEFTISLKAFNDPASIQFIHRNVAYLVTISLLYISFRLYKHAPFIAAILALSIIAQLLLGILTVIYQVPIKLALLHQLFAVLCLSATLYIRRFYDRI